MLEKNKRISRLLPLLNGYLNITDPITAIQDRSNTIDSFEPDIDKVKVCLLIALFRTACPMSIISFLEYHTSETV